MKKGLLAVAAALAFSVYSNAQPNEQYRVISPNSDCAAQRPVPEGEVKKNRPRDDKDKHKPKPAPKPKESGD